MIALFFKLVDFLIHPAAKRDVHRYIKIKGLISLGLIYQLTLLGVILIAPTLNVTLVLLCGSLAAGFIIAKLTGWHEIMAHVLILFLSVMLLYMIHVAGTIRHHTVYWIPVIVVASLYASGPVYGSLTLLGLFSGVSYIFYREFIPGIPVTELFEEKFFFKQMSLALFVVYILSLVYEKTSRAHIAMLERSQRDLDLQKQKTIEASQLSALGEMAGGIAHEINNPLAIIRGNAEVLTKLNIDHPQLLPRALKIIGTVERIEKIITSMRNLSRQDKNLEYKSENLSLIVDEVLVFFREKMQSLGLKLEVQLDPSLVAQCNRIHIGQIIVNLMNNAIDAIQEQKAEEGWILLRLERLQSFAELTVSNSGPKISEELSHNIMRPFFTTKAIGKGTGLGLSISKRFAEQHDGDLSLDLRGTHTTFVVRLPLLAESESKSKGLSA